MKHVALVMSLNKRFDRKVIEGVTRFVRESGKWSVFVEDDPQAKIPNFLHGHFDGVIADLGTWAYSHGSRGAGEIGTTATELVIDKENDSSPYSPDVGDHEGIYLRLVNRIGGRVDAREIAQAHGIARFRTLRRS